MISPDRWPDLQRDLNEMASGLPRDLVIKGKGTKGAILPRGAGLRFQLPDRDPILEHDPADQVAVLWAGASVEDVQQALGEHGQCLPLPQTGHKLVDGWPGSIGGLAAMSLPHGLEAQRGPVRDWVLGMAVIWGDGKVSRCGSKAVKSVAGYDIHRMMCGARGTLGLICAIAMRTVSVENRGEPTAEAVRPWHGNSVWIQRVLASDYEEARAEADLFAADPATATLWHTHPPRRFTEDWLIGPDGEFEGRRVPDPLLAQAKLAFDPHNRFNPHLKP